jgi:hypothetical protein
MKLGLKKVYPWRSLGRILLTTCICAIVFKLILIIFGENIPAIITGTLLFCVIYLFILSRRMESPRLGEE